MNSEIDSEVVDLIQQQRQMQGEAETLAAHQLNLREQLTAAEEKALDLHHEIVEDKCDVGCESSFWESAVPAAGQTTRRQ